MKSKSEADALIAEAVLSNTDLKQFKLIAQSKRKNI